MSLMKTNAIGNCPFTFLTDIAKDVVFSVSAPANIRSLLGGKEGSVLDTLGGEYKWSGFVVRLYKNRGADNGFTVRYGVNLVDLEQEKNIENMYTSVIASWLDPGGGGQVVYSDLYDSPAAANYPITRTKVIDLSNEYGAVQPTKAALNAYAKTYAEEVLTGAPEVSINVKFAALPSSVTHGKVNLCDTATVYFEKLGISTKAKVVRTEWDVLRDKYISIDIGTIRSGLAKTLQTTINNLSAQITEYTKPYDTFLKSYILAPNRWHVLQDPSAIDPVYSKAAIDGVSLWYGASINYSDLNIPGRFISKRDESTGWTFLNDDVRLTIYVRDASGIIGTDEEGYNIERDDYRADLHWDATTERWEWTQTKYNITTYIDAVNSNVGLSLRMWRIRDLGNTIEILAPPFLQLMMEFSFIAYGGRTDTDGTVNYGVTLDPAYHSPRIVNLCSPPIPYEKPALNGDTDAKYAYIVETGKSGIWEYRKWSDGSAECWGMQTVTANVTTAWGGLYVSGPIAASDVAFPFTFSAVPQLMTSLIKTTSGGFLIASGNGTATSATSTGTVEIARGTSAGNLTYKISYHARGSIA